MWTKTFWKDEAERLIVTAAQVILGLFTAQGFNLLTVDWQVFLVTVAVAVIVSLLKAIVAVNVSNTISPASLAPDGGK